MSLRVLLVSTYEMGRQPFGLASPAAWLREAGFRVDCLDLSVDPLDQDAAARADLIAFFVPMHLATRLAVDALLRVRVLNDRAHICFYGLYAPVNEAYLRSLGAESIMGGEFEEGLLRIARDLAAERQGPGTHGSNATVEERDPGPDGDGTNATVNARELGPDADGSDAIGKTGPDSTGVSRSDTIGKSGSVARVSLARQRFRVPDRSGLPTLDRYAAFVDSAGKKQTVGYTEASRGCKHRCRHCPIVPVYDGRFRIVQREIVLEDIRRQILAGARHITFGDPDFFNGIGHALPIVEALHREHPQITYDATIKVEHLLRHAEHLSTLTETGCALVTTAVESFDETVLRRLDKGHSPADIETAVELCRRAGLPLAPTFVAFTPWTSLPGYLGFLREIARLGLVEHVAPVQYAIRLLIPAGSRILELDDVSRLARSLDRSALFHPWEHPDAAVDELQRALERLVQRLATVGAPREAVYRAVWEHACSAAHLPEAWMPERPVLPDRATVPYLTEPWYC